MPLKFSCFISYRHSSVASGASFVRDFVGGFAEELDRWANYHICFDEERLQPGDFIDESLAANLYASACMVVLYTPTYFNTERMFCSREYFGMLDLEKQRIPLLGGQDEHGLIFPIALRGHSTMVKRVQVAEEQWSAGSGLPVRNRFAPNFEQFSKKSQLRSGVLNEQLRKICERIGERETAFEGLVRSGTDPFLAGTTWRLPPEQAISSWVNGVLGYPIPPRLPSQAA
ncbi:MAG: TIR domain-containing protein [Candidatus Sulfotelmatobacter sp.]